jgi:chemotaxis protein MotA
MHLFLGVIVTLLAFLASKWAQANMPYFGLFNPAALVLLAIGPFGVSLISHQFKEWRSNFSVLLRAFRSDQTENLLRASDDMMQIGRAVREARWQDAEAAIARTQSEQVKLLAAHLLSRLEPDAMREAIGSSAFRWMSEVKLADEFFQSLARLGPAFGMIGTIMGLVDLFGHMRDSASLGPGMAVALLATLYGLILCYCIYMPLAQRVRAYLAAGVGEQRLIERAIGLIIEGRPVHEIRNALLDAASNGLDRPGSASSPPPPSEIVQR